MSRREAERGRGVALVAGSGVLFSTSGLGVRLMEEAGAWQIVFYRALFQAAVVTLWVLLRRDGGVASFRRVGWAGVVGAVGLAVAYNGMIYALTLTTVATVVFIFSAAPLLTALLARAVLGERVGWVSGGAMALSVVGIAVMNAGEPRSGAMLGQLAAGAAALGVAVWSVALRAGRDVDMLPTVALSGVLAALMGSTLVESFTLTTRDAALCFYLGAGVLALGLAMFTAGSRFLRAAELPLIAMTENVLAPLWVWIFLGEAVSRLTLVGGAIVLAAALAPGLAAARGTPR